MAASRACNRRRATYVLVAVRAVILCVGWPSVCLLPLQVIDDPCGNSFVESTEAPSVDPQLTVEHYTRTQEQDLQLGILNAGFSFQNWILKWVLVPLEVASQQ